MKIEKFMIVEKCSGEMVIGIQGRIFKLLVWYMARWTDLDSLDGFRPPSSEFQLPSSESSPDCVWSYLENNLPIWKFEIEIIRFSRNWKFLEVIFSSEDFDEFEFSSFFFQFEETNR